MNFQAAGDHGPRDHSPVAPLQDRPRAAGNERVFLFLQGPISPFFPMIAKDLEARGARTIRVNLCFGDVLFWRRGGAVNYRGTREGWPAFIAELMDREGVSDLLLLGEQHAICRSHRLKTCWQPRCSTDRSGYLCLSSIEVGIAN